MTYQDDFSLAFPLQKINKEQRVVTGIATANNLDIGGDIIDFQASVEAFSSWIGNIREMHDPKSAVGKLIDWRPTKVMHHGKMYDAIEVDVYISKGAESTWQKILDGTLRGFSIGGRTLEKERIYDEETGRYADLITKYMLGELSVVDNPCNPTGMFMLIKRASDGELEEVLEESTSVFYCSEHKYATIDDNKICPTCSKEMENIGFVQEFNADVINKMISSYELDKEREGSEIMDLHKNEDGASIASTMNDLSDQQKTTILSKFGNLLFGSEQAVSPLTVPNVIVNINKGMFAEEEVSVEEVVEVEDHKEDAENEIEKSVNSIEQVSEKEESMDLEEILKGVGSLLDEKLTAVKEEISAEVDAKVSAIEKSVSDFKDEATETLSKVEGDIEKVANTGAIQKSEVIEDEGEKLEKIAPKKESFWGGIWVPGEFVEALGYES